MTVVVIIVCVINVLLWCVGITRFNKKFSTQAVIDKAREELNKMLIDMNHNAERNISLLEDRIQKLKAVIAEADSHVKLMNVELAKADKADALKEKLAPKQEQSVQPKKTRVQKARTPVDIYRVEQLQGNLFVSEEKKAQEKEVEKVSSIAEKPPRASQEVAEVFSAAESIVPKLDFRSQARQLADLGMTVEEIAIKLSRSTQEVEFALAF